VEDDASNASLVTRVLARRPDIRLLSAERARAGLELARRHRPDLLLLDLHLPDLPGDEVVSLIKADPDLADIKVVVVSADAMPGRIRRMLDLGVEGYLTKPLSVEALLKLVDDQVAGRRAATGG
jgi:CheY-like chemotaxis protein